MPSSLQQQLQQRLLCQAEHLIVSSLADEAKEFGGALHGTLGASVVGDKVLTDNDNGGEILR